MDIRRSDRCDPRTPLRPILSGKAAFSSKIGLSFFKLCSDAGIVSGVFFGVRRGSPRATTMMAEVLHERGDAAVQLVPNSLAQTQFACADE